MQGKGLITELSHRMGWTKQETADMVSTLSTVISSSLVDGDTVSLQGLGQFESRKLIERVTSDDRSEKQYLLPPELVPIFKPDEKWINTLTASTDEIKD